MSEFQNKAVRLTVACSGAASVTNLGECQKRFLVAALELNNALEQGSDQTDRSLVAAGSTRRIDLIIGDLMKELAVVGHLFDIDIMQAGHNTLDRRMAEIKGALIRP
ncbi:hypothetical protein [Sinorhizobium sp. GL28]|uniref:hypothetical protein n=1 Tax=Sinorhizobium sp. GL28 TaxID=1358418 RepID=UPI00071DE861|nr:hypothetical protein [Sinorhizobium sp. GL28]KSV88588.1 hypothetical protein N184_28970 [Sinorhizobium sp. GL28]